MKQMTKLSFDKAAYAAQLTAFRKDSVAADGKADSLGSTGMAALLLGELSPLALAVTFYSTFNPTNAAGKAVEPKEKDDGTIGVRNLEQPHVRGSAGARVLLERLLYCYAMRDTSPATAKAVEAFAMGDKFTHNNRSTRNITMLQALIKAERMAAAKANAEGASEGASDEATDDATVEAATTDAERLASALKLLAAVSEVADASARLIVQSIATEVDRIAAIQPVEADELQQAA
jgi:hypothetical protein